jgi:hypothetical protein
VHPPSPSARPSSASSPRSAVPARARTSTQDAATRPCIPCSLAHTPLLA